ncbi:MAG: hypothetical protein L6Q46_13485 [Flavobacterium sp.]|uniref:MAE_28990/MAE_18760 family HEPN-like nuclease n=1 Tax=Flavobacterium sp. TaxID=239 RepID=UPI0025BA3218|nr:MAE_28990/MAE_18760 family HEPN-like nuclease [Flavobacterium sp.]MCK6609292.1 hypothetical protein [Flavobacterium sp.]
MTFTLIKNRARARFNENLTYLNYLTSLESNDATIPATTELKIMKGLFYVHLYSSLEKTVNDLIENTLISINSQSIKKKHFHLPFNTISLLGKLQAFKDCGYKNFFGKAIEIFEEMNSDSVSNINETAFSNSLQNVCKKTIIEILSAFGITNFTIDPRTRTTIDEIVEKRNAVAHGRESATYVGERFRTTDLRIKMNTITAFTFELIDLFENYHDNKKFIKPQSKKHYVATP